MVPMGGSRNESILQQPTACRAEFSKVARAPASVGLSLFPRTSSTTGVTACRRCDARSHVLSKRRGFGGWSMT